MFPSQDTPAIKSTYSAKVKSTLPVLMSAIRQSPPPEEVLEMGKEVEYIYDQVSLTREGQGDVKVKAVSRVSLEEKGQRTPPRSVDEHAGRKMELSRYGR